MLMGIELEKSVIALGHYLLIKLSLKSEQVQFNISGTSVFGVGGQAPRFFNIYHAQLN